MKGRNKPDDKGGNEQGEAPANTEVCNMETALRRQQQAAAGCRKRI